MKEIKMWKAEDGEIFDNEEECLQYEKSVKATMELSDAVGCFFFSSMTAPELLEDLIERAESLSDILGRIASADAKIEEIRAKKEK
jgi:hypothetical protein